MKITLKNKELSPAISLLQAMNLKSADSRCRSKLVKLIVAAFEEYAEDEKKLMGQYHLLDEEGSLLEENKRDLEMVREFNKDQQVLLNEKVVIEGGMYAKNIDEIPRILNEYDGELTGEDAEIYDRLLDEFEKEVAE